MASEARERVGRSSRKTIEWPAAWEVLRLIEAMATSQPLMSIPPLSTPPEIGGDRFIAEVVLEMWTRTRRAHRVGGVLWLDDDHIHDVVDAVRVLGRRGAESDRFGWTGRVFPLRELVRLGASIGPDSACLASATYDIEYGVLLEADETVPVEERVTLNPPRPATGGLVMSRPITGAGVASRPANGYSRPPAEASSSTNHYGSSPGRYNASGLQSVAGLETSVERRPPSGPRQRAY